MFPGETWMNLAVAVLVSAAVIFFGWLIAKNS